MRTHVDVYEFVVHGRTAQSRQIKERIYLNYELCDKNPKMCECASVMIIHRDPDSMFEEKSHFKSGKYLLWSGLQRSMNLHYAAV